MLIDGLKLHERAKMELEAYAVNNSTEEKPIRKVKPFMMVVCKDTEHAKWVESYIKSDEFNGGAYRNKTIIVHSKQTGSESEDNTKLLLDVENYDNPIEIVIHINMLKEGWDVNNLYTIVPLRTAASSQVFLGENLNKYVDENIIFTFDGLMQQKAGSNIRNRIGHGLNLEKECYTGDCIYFVMIILKLCAMYCRGYLYEKNKRLNTHIENKKTNI